MSYRDRSDDTSPHPRLRMFQRSTPFVSWASLLAVLGIVVTALTGGLPVNRDAQGSNTVTLQQMQVLEQQLQDHAQKIHENQAAMQDQRDSVQQLIQGQKDQQQQISDLDYKTTRILELMLESKNNSEKDRGRR